MTEFGSFNLEEMAGEDARLNDAGGGNFLDQFVPMPDVKPGATGAVNVRILPPTKGGRLYQYNRTHKLNERSIHCPRPLVNGKWDRNVTCPICDYYSALWKQIEKLEKQGHVAECEKLKEEARQLKPVERYYYNAIVRSIVVEGKEMKNVGPRILSVGKILHKMIIRAIVGDEADPDSKLGNISDLKAGYDFIIRKEVSTGVDNFPKYDRSGFARTSSPAGSSEEIAKWAEGLHDLSKLRNPKGVEDLEKELAIHRGLIPDAVETFDTNAFDAKFRKEQKETVQELMEYSGTNVSVDVDVAAMAASTAPATKVETPKVEDVTIEDEAFLQELKDMEN